MIFNLLKDDNKLVQPKNWTQWKMAYKSAKDLGTCLALLVGILDVPLDDALIPKEQNTERMVALLELADGFTLLDAEQLKTTEGQLKAAAYQVLEERFFALTVPTGGMPTRQLRQYTPEVLRKVLWFFRPRERLFPHEEGAGIHNLRLHAEQKLGARSFFNELMKSIWTEELLEEPGQFSREDRYRDQDTLALAKTLKPTVIKLLHAYAHGSLQRLLRLGSVDGKPQWHRFDNECLETLEFLALSTTRFDALDEPVKVTSVEEALMLGSSAAHLLVVVRAAQKEGVRLRRLEDAEREAREAANRLEQLRQQTSQE